MAHQGNMIEHIRRRAYEIWMSEGCRHGHDRDHWLRAEAEYRAALAVKPDKQGKKKPGGAPSPLPPRGKAPRKERIG